MSQNMLMPPPQPGIPTVSTQALLGDYTSTALQATPTPLRTPMQENIIMQEAKNLRALRDITPFSDTEMPELLEGTGFEGIQPRKATVATPNTLLVNSNQSGAGSNTPLLTGTPQVGGGSSALVRSTPLSIGGRTPLRDQLGLNDMSSTDMYSVSDDVSMSSRLSRIRERDSKLELNNKLRSLPEPEYAYEVSIPVIEEEGAVEEQVQVEDEADVIARQQRLVQEEIEAEERRRSTVLRRELPRPITVVSSLLTNKYDQRNSTDKELAHASALMNKEQLMLLSHDLYKYPIDIKSLKNTSTNRVLPKTTPVELDTIDDEKIQYAKELIEQEILALQSENGAWDQRAFDMKHDELLRALVYVPDKGTGGSFVLQSNCNKNEVSIIYLYRFINVHKIIIFYIKKLEIRFDTLNLT